MKRMVLSFLLCIFFASTSSASVLPYLFLDEGAFAFAAKNDNVFVGLCGIANIQQIDTALKMGANANADIFGITPLMSAVLLNPDPRVAAALINAGANVNARTFAGITPLALSAFAALHSANPQFEEIIETAIFSPLENFLDRTNLEVLENLKKSLPTLRDSLSKSNPEVITLLINAGARVNERVIGGGTPVMIAAAGNPNPEVITALAKGGADLNAVSNNGMTPLRFAIRHNSNPEVIDRKTSCRERV